MSYASPARQPAIDLFEYDPLTGAARLRGDSVVLPSLLFDAEGRCLRFLDRLAAQSQVLPGEERALREAVKALAKGAGRSACELRLHKQDGRFSWVRLALFSQGAGLCAMGMAEDVTKQKETLGCFVNESQFYQAVLAEQDAYGQVDVTENRIMRIGGMWNLYNELIDEVPYSDLVAGFIDKVVHPEDRRHYSEIMRCENFSESFENGIERLGCEFRRIVDQNKMTWMRLSVHLFRDPLTEHILALLYIKNIDDKKRQELLLLRDSTRDQLTNIYNKMMAQREVSDYLASVPDNERYAFVILDLDDFKDINDLRGHAVGDRALIRMASTLGRAFRKDDVVGRFGGDEFVILLKNIKSKEWVGERLADLVDELRGDAELPLACSSGVVYAEGPTTYERLFRRADIALYAAKSAGKGRFVFADDLDEVDLWETSPEGTGPASRRTRPGGPLFKGGEPEPFADAPADFDAFVSEQGDMAYLIDSETFDLVCGNKAFYDRLGLAEEQCRGMKCYEVTQKRDTPCPFCGKMNWSADKFYLWKNFNGVLDQEFLMKNKLVSWQGREALLAIAVDVSNDKSIVDSLASCDADAHSALGGVQRMSEAGTLLEALDSALETVGCFFRADAVRFWRRCEADEPYSCIHAWGRGSLGALDGAELAAVDEWLGAKRRTEIVSLESPEAALRESFGLYRYLEDHAIRNQRWVPLGDKDGELGYLSIDNLSSNLQNELFLDSFSTFFSTELNKRILVENVLSFALRDDLTGLLSRRSFEERLASYCADDVRSVGVVLANFNNLKGVNSTRGFRTGNYYLRQFAGVLTAAFSEFDVYRLNGDEFLAIAANVGQVDLGGAVRAVEESVRDIGSFSVALGSSWDDVERDLKVLIEQATRTMKANKALYYDTSADAEAADHRKMLDDLIAALDREEFVVFFQPKVELDCGQVIGAEALVRYCSESAGTVLPSQFIDLLERNNLIRYIDLFVLEEVCRQLECWKRAGLFLPVVSLNFSRLTLLERDIVSSVESIVSRYDVAKDRLEIEITESVADIGKNILCQTARDLYDAGYAISLDDFGTKYTNLSMLADVNFGVLKLDKSLVGALGSRTNYQAILKNIIRMCQDLVIEVIAEGVETHEQEAILRDLECKLGQGYLYGKPMPANEFERIYLWHE